jgi:hypothetical protein
MRFSGNQKAEGRRKKEEVKIKGLKSGAMIAISCLVSGFWFLPSDF